MVLNLFNILDQNKKTEIIIIQVSRLRAPGIELLEASLNKSAGIDIVKHSLFFSGTLCFHHFFRE
jgi:hypothetical protein